MESSTLVVMRGVTKYYNGQVCALDHVDLTIERGEWVSVMGPSGSGKTTFLNIISCLDRPSHGQVLVEGVDIGQLSGDELTRFRREKIGLIFQQFYLVPYLNALENVMLAQYFHSMADAAEAREALRQVGPGGRLDP